MGVFVLKRANLAPRAYAQRSQAVFADLFPAGAAHLRQAGFNPVLSNIQIRVCVARYARPRGNR